MRRSLKRGLRSAMRTWPPVAVEAGGHPVREMRQGDRPGFRDRAAHKALVRCGAPAAVSVGGVDYPIGGLARPLEADNWKVDLWRAVCAVPSS